MTHGRFEGVVGAAKWVQSSHCDSAVNTDSNKSKSRIPYADQKRRKELSSGIGYATVIRRKIFEPKDGTWQQELRPLRSADFEWERLSRSCPTFLDPPSNILRVLHNLPLLQTFPLNLRRSRNQVQDISL